jgi:hypothetical protein
MQVYSFEDAHVNDAQATYDPSIHPQSMAASIPFEPLHGHCSCKTITYTLSAPPLVTHCCHCTVCKREVGSAFTLNSLVETSHFQVTSTTSPLAVKVPTPSGGGQTILRCPSCYVAVFSHNGDWAKWLTWVKTGTLVDGSRERCKPSVHIFTSTKDDWVDLSGEIKRGIRIYERFYEREDVYSEEALKRWKVVMEKKTRDEQNERT